MRKSNSSKALPERPVDSSIQSFEWTPQNFLIAHPAQNWVFFSPYPFIEKPATVRFLILFFFALLPFVTQAQQIIDFFAVKPTLKNPHLNAYERMMMFLHERMRAKRDAWLTEIGHKRPMRKGKPLAEADKVAAEKTKLIKQNLETILKQAKQP